MHLVKIATFAALSLLLTGCKTISVTPHKTNSVTPQASTISSSEIAAEQLIKNSMKLGNVAIYFEEINLRAKAYATVKSGAHQSCPSLNHEIDLTAPYTETMRNGFRQAFPTAEFVTTPLTLEQMKAKNIQVQIQLKKPTASVSYIFFHKGFSIDLGGTVELKGPLIVANQSGAIKQRVLQAEDKDEILDLTQFGYMCDASTMATLIENAATRTIFQFALKNAAASKDMIQMLNSQK